jgi:hypothetical protein
LSLKLKFSENWKSKNGFSWITLKFQVICWDIYFLKGYDAGFPKKCKFSINSCFGKKFSGGSLCTRGTAGIWAVDLFSTTYFDEIIIFELSKDQTFRIRCTLMNPKQILILVTHLLLVKRDFKFFILWSFHWKVLFFQFMDLATILCLCIPGIFFK